jgi:iron complex transport system substrate-binding protein
VAEIFASITAVGKAAGVPDRARTLVAELEARVGAVTSITSQAQHRPRLMSLEGVNPMVAGGHWIPELKRLAGGEMSYSARVVRRSGSSGRPYATTIRKSC